MELEEELLLLLPGRPSELKTSFKSTETFNFDFSSSDIVIIIRKAACSSGLGGASSSTSARNRQAQVDILAELRHDSWNSFQPLTDEEIESYLKDSFVSTLNKKSSQPLLPIPGIVQPALERKRRSPQTSNRISSSQSGTSNVLSRVTDFLNDDLDSLENDLESSDNEVIMYMNNRVDTIMDTVDQAMEHSG